METLIKTLPAILQSAGDSIEVREAACIAAWIHVAGAGLREHALPMRLSEKALVIAVADQTWQKQLESLSSQLLFRINQVIGEAIVDSLDFRIEPGALAEARLFKKTNQPYQAADHAIPLELATAATQIADKDLRRAFLGAAIVSLERLEKSQI